MVGGEAVYRRAGEGGRAQESERSVLGETEGRKGVRKMEGS